MAVYLLSRRLTRSMLLLAPLLPVSCFLLSGARSNTSPDASASSASHHIHTVFIIMMENHNWTGDGAKDIKNNSEAPFINHTIVPDGAHPSNYNNPPHIHPSLPNYLWLEAGTNFGILNDGHAGGQNTQTTRLHLVTLLEEAGISWRSYDAWANGKTCPVSEEHVPFTFFDDVMDYQNRHYPYCIAHLRPLAELDGDLASGRTARYNFIVPNLCQAMHSKCGNENQIKAGDNWLKSIVPRIVDSSAYRNGGALFIVFDEAAKGDGPIPMLILSPYARRGYTNYTYYNHSSTLRTVEEIFGVDPLLRNAGDAPDLHDFFTVFP